MSTKNFIGLLVALLWLAGWLPSVRAREGAPLDERRKFIQGAARGAEPVGFDGVRWASVALPHDRGIAGPFATTNKPAGPQTELQYLSGRGPKDAVAWDFQISGGRRSGEAATIPVPSNWELHGFGSFTYGQEINTSRPSADSTAENSPCRKAGRAAGSISFSTA
ncbi:MAG: hypothetical protein NTZ16_08980 [Verrucomicrobia bacterium]|nr:hypothetical protein [Verrucomicrobiota bacterium]